mmetsp:Transcript_30875/g.46873  ORF Transcript_30875/g.46873 Transcript_30875/m.46873 type:complete len:373 (+) Transcript_30875:141-1259(+)|eukprot:CAMPEP_0178932692 /NCGR_PEP_ID=MMETSP0786-20121207/22778_1 /TAXON_ID=186022 /ORGANISM="Thalassionema frauenfeldii, Strain CCMP 1798" /LENGTH=372 /DNA_ID=CAMNT_0020610051 /DNA_START=52 /DNA_END=1170 /DNA_ORIENTATION=-
MLSHLRRTKTIFHPPASQRAASGSPSTMITDLLKDFRWKAAQLITSNLDEKERSKLLDLTKEGEDNQATATIGEAVAAARVEEAQKLNNQWKKQKEQLLMEAEEASRARVENEVQLVVKQPKAEEKAEHHTLLGPVVVDLGYKKIYQVSAKTLTAIPVWQKQRLYRHDRAKVILKDKLKTTHLGLPGIIVLHEDKDGKLSILDGQHRVGALALLWKKDPTAFDLENILVEVYSSCEKDISEEVFCEINKSEPIKLVDMPGVTSAKERQILTDSAAKLQDLYPDMFKPSQQCRAPHLNIDNLRDSLHAAEILKKHSIKSTKGLVEWITEQNEALKEKYNNNDEEMLRKVKPNALQKAKKYDFYLGLDSSWLYN